MPPRLRHFERAFNSTSFALLWSKLNADRTILPLPLTLPVFEKPLPLAFPKAANAACCARVTSPTWRVVFFHIQFNNGIQGNAIILLYVIMEIKLLIAMFIMFYGVFISPEPCVPWVVIIILINSSLIIPWCIFFLNAYISYTLKGFAVGLPPLFPLESLGVLSSQVLESSRRCMEP